MIAAPHVIGIDVSRGWLDGFCLPSLQRFRLANSADGHEDLISMSCQMSGLIQIGFEATGGQEWALWAALVAAGIEARQLPPAQIKAFAMSRGTRAKTDRIDAELIARFMVFRPDAGRTLPSDSLRVVRALTTRRAQIVEMRKRLTTQIASRKKQDIPAGIEHLDAELKAMLDAQSAISSNASITLFHAKKPPLPKLTFCVPSPALARFLRPCSLQRCRNSVA